MGIIVKEDGMVEYRAASIADLAWRDADPLAGHPGAWRPKRTRRARRRWRGKRKAVRASMDQIGRSFSRRWSMLSDALELAKPSPGGVLMDYQRRALAALQGDGVRSIHFGHGASAASPETMEAVRTLVRAAMDEARDNVRGKGMTMGSATLSIGGDVVAKGLTFTPPALNVEPAPSRVMVMGRVSDQVTRYLRDLASRPGIVVVDEVEDMLPISLSETGKAHVDRMLRDHLEPPASVVEAERAEALIQRTKALHTPRKHRGRRRGR